MKRKIAIILLCCFMLTGAAGCGNTTEAVKEIIWTNDAHNSEEMYDVIVVGTEPEGVSAAVSAARNGMKTLLLGEDAALGGLMTIGELNFIDMCEPEAFSVSFTMLWMAAPLILQKLVISF